MTRPGTVVVQRDSAPPRTPPTDSGVWFVAGLTEKGPTTPTLITSLIAFRRTFGERVSYSVLSDAVETFFREGGSKVYVRRLVGAGADPASVALADGTATTLTVSAPSAGDWGNALNVTVETNAEDVGIPAGSFRLVVTNDDGEELERSPVFADKAAALAWTPTYVTLTSGPGTGDPVAVADASLTSGDDDRAAITDAVRVAALADFGRQLGPGQVSIPGATTADAHAGLLAHAADRNRVAILDADDDPSATALQADAATDRGNVNATHGGLFAPWVTIPGLTPGQVRTVPPSAAVAGRIAQVDAAGNPNVAAAGEQGRLVSVSAPTQEWADDEREALNEAGVNVIRTVYGEPRVYGFRTLASKDDEPLHWQLANVRLDMAITAKAEAIAERYVFRPIDGKGLTFAAFGGELASLLGGYYAVGALYGATADDAFRVDVGPAVNTPETIADGELRALLAIRRSPFAELVEVDVVKVATTEAV